jgi:hypothetical protein
MVGWYQNAFGLRVEARGYFDPVNADFVMLTGAGFRLELGVTCGRPSSPG